MAKNLWVGLVCLTLISGSALAADPTTQPTTKTAQPSQPADIAAPKLGKDGKLDKHFETMHELFLRRFDLVFLGDSITEGWSGRGKDVWAKTYAADHAANFGIGGDRTQHVLWRIDNGELDGINPKVLVLMIGTNNLGSNTADEIAAADVKIVSEIHQKLPNTKVLLLAIFPRDADVTSPRREKIKAINAQLAKLEDGKMTRYLDFGDKFLTPDGVLGKDIMPDLLHPNAKGYQIWADAMRPLLDEMMK